MNVRLDKLASKITYKLKDKYYDDETIINLGTSFELDNESIKPRSQPLVKQIQEIIFNDPSNCPWNDPVHPSDWTPPLPIFK